MATASTSSSRRPRRKAPGRRPTALALKGGDPMLALRESERRFAVFMKNTPAAAWMKDDQSRYVFVNEAFARIHGSTVAEILGKRDSQVWPRDVVRQMRAHDRQVRRTGRPLQAVEKVRGRDGRDRLVWAIKFPFRDAAGRRFVGGQAVDVTERHRVEESLRDTEAELRRVTSSISDYLWSVELDERGRDVQRYFSPVVKDVTGRPAEFFRSGRHRWLSIIHPDDRVRLLELSRRIRSAHLRKVETVYRIFRPDGAVRWLRDCVVIRRLPNGHMRFDGVVSDITERKQAEDALRNAETELHRVTGSISDYLWSVELDERGRDVRRFFSPVIESITGRPPEFYLPGPHRWLGTVHPEDRDRVWKSARHLRTGRIRKLEDEYRILHTDGSVRWVRNSVVSRRLPDGHRRIDGIVSDITARKQAEAALRGLPARILAAQEAERHRIAGELHDGVGQTLSAAKFRLHAAEAALPAASPGASSLHRAGELALLALRDVRRITRNLRPSELDDLGLLPALHSFVDEFRDRTRLRVDFSVRGSLNDLPADLSLAVFRVVQEGLGNIEKHAKAARAHLQLSRTARQLRLRLSDDGRGFRTRRRNHHHGLGLVHMRERATALGGTLVVESVPRRGTRVLASWPFSREQKD
ncbi:MAG: PAS domain S-box protein [Verrucomicrobia bacterium]|nr:PAS domain S-box protein [Verrucomicrobiota bacterium]